MSERFGDGLISEAEYVSKALDERWSHVQRKAHPRWWWLVWAPDTGQGWAYGCGRRQDDVCMQLQRLVEAWGTTHSCTDGWDAGRAVAPTRNAGTIGSSGG
jgi:IS1 family transposase